MFNIASRAFAPLFALLGVLCVYSLSNAAPKADADVRTFELRPIAPPTPAMSIRLLFDPLEKHPGNAVIYYLQATMFHTPASDKAIEEAIEAIDAKDDAAFREKMKDVPDERHGMFEMLDLGGRCDSCDWQPAIRERGVLALLPHLNEMRHMGNALRARTELSIRDGNTEQAISDLRLGYQLAQHGGTEPVLISGLVSISIARGTNESLISLMNAPNAPNLYWALVDLPRPFVDFRTGIRGERVFLVATVPLIARARDRANLSPDEWRSAFRALNALMDQTASEGTPATRPVYADLKDAAVMAVALPKAQLHYASTRKMPRDDVAKLDPMMLVGTWYYEQYIAVTDDILKVTNLPYPQLIERLGKISAEVDRAYKEAPNNPLIALVPSVQRAALSYAILDRQIAALTAVEAIRSYAAAHDGTMPEKLDDVTDTPVPQNPMTGKPFEYETDGKEARLSDRRSERKLDYTIRIRH